MVLTPLLHWEVSIAEQKLGLSPRIVLFASFLSINPLVFNPGCISQSTKEYFLNHWFLGPILDQFNGNICTEIDNMGSEAGSLSLYPGPTMQT